MGVVRFSHREVIDEVIQMELLDLAAELQRSGASEEHLSHLDAAEEWIHRAILAMHDEHHRRDWDHMVADVYQDPDEPEFYDLWLFATTAAHLHPDSRLARDVAAIKRAVWEPHQALLKEKA